MQDDDDEIQFIESRKSRTTTAQPPRHRDIPSTINANIRAKKSKRGGDSQQSTPAPRPKETEIITISSDEDDNKPVPIPQKKRTATGSSNRPIKRKTTARPNLPVKAPSKSPPVKTFSKNPPSKSSPKKQPSPPVYTIESDSDDTMDQGYLADSGADDVAGVLAATSIYDEGRFKPMAPQESKVNTSPQDHTTKYSPPKRSNRRPNLNASARTKSTGNSLGLWSQIELIHAAVKTPHASGTRRRTFPRYPFRVTRLAKSSGPVNKIVQKEGLVAVASSTPGGHSSCDEEHDSDTTEPDIDTGNRDGGSLLWNGVRESLLQPHTRTAKVKIPEPMSGDSEVERSTIVKRTKFYTVNDIKFDPSNRRIVTSAGDKRINVVNYLLTDDDDDDLYTLVSETRNCHVFKDVPLDISFKPVEAGSNESILAVAAKQIYLFNGSDLDYITHVKPVPLLAVGKKDSDQSASAGPFTWGVGPSSNQLFVSTEPGNEILGKGYHRCFDVETQRKIVQFDAPEAGDAMALDQSGSKLALLTRTSSENFLRLYEAQNSKMSRSTSHTVTLMPSQVHGLPLEVSTAAFSPDGIYIAVARRDNRTHVYDSRYLDRLLYDFRHSGRSRASPGHDSYGVTQVEWTQSPLTNSLGLITGGMDGCVRLWRPLWASDNKDGKILCETEGDIGYFSLGDRGKQEHDLVVGDGDGGIWILDGLRDSL